MPSTSTLGGSGYDDLVIEEFGQGAAETTAPQGVCWICVAPGPVVSTQPASTAGRIA